MENMIILKKKYNTVLQREQKACLYLNNKNINLVTVEESYIPEYQKITKELSEIMNMIPDATKQELLTGFKI